MLSKINLWEIKLCISVNIYPRPPKLGMGTPKLVCAGMLCTHSFWYEYSKLAYAMT